ncbi:MAG: hypothetical protein Q8N88_00340 [Nanoarchaeota archaeon]|nr:hypothetical protein [Nanoarchaeota archaeon]
MGEYRVKGQKYLVDGGAELKTLVMKLESAYETYHGSAPPKSWTGMELQLTLKDLHVAKEILSYQKNIQG